MFSSSRVRGRALVRDPGSRDSAVWEPDTIGLPAADESESSTEGAVDDSFDFGAHDPEVDAAEMAALELRMQIDAAYDRGYEDGRAEGRAAEATRTGGAVRVLEEATIRFREDGPRWQEALQQNLVALATALAREIIGRELKGSVEDLNGLVQRAVSEFPLEAAVRIRLNPVDLTAISTPLGGSATEAGRQVRWIPDPDIAPGGCVVEGPESIVDGRIEKALDRIYSRLIYG